MNIVRTRSKTTNCNMYDSVAATNVLITLTAIFVLIIYNGVLKIVLNSQKSLGIKYEWKTETSSRVFAEVLFRVCLQSTLPFRKNIFWTYHFIKRSFTSADSNPGKVLFGTHWNVKVFSSSAIFVWNMPGVHDGICCWLLGLSRLSSVLNFWATFGVWSNFLRFQQPPANFAFLSYFWYQAGKSQRFHRKLHFLKLLLAEHHR